ncbi:hypothetical protein O9H85_18340 [Paenibacillus filicis]|uniref:WYL domain-containing protein n=1 Tax=Paenibacillus gyeongsangnamensis TaxID=3388067 RepID=A0ABT4QC02_9BACL|nr:hypothetical protein [Paenibacillus filicis]MCZ8514348.1 hypothetical protein [Paenibacillus filicis]
MVNSFQKYLSRTVEIIYFGCDNKITQRRIEVRAITSRDIKAVCLDRKAPRTFLISNILAVQPLRRAA